MVAAANDSNGKRLLGLLTGVAFGALLQRGRLARYDVILGQLLLRDGRVVKAMGSAVAVGAIGVHALVRRGLAKKEIKPMKVGGIVGGAALFGAGLALLGYCPGTAVAAVGEGRRDALDIFLPCTQSCPLWSEDFTFTVGWLVRLDGKCHGRRAQEIAVDWIFAPRKPKPQTEECISP